MNKKALYAVMLVILLPLISYFIVKRKSEHVLVMPPHYFPDTVLTITKKGKNVRDTVWHRLKDFTLTNQEGRTVSWDSLRGKIVIADFFFTHCPTICPTLTLHMKRLAESVNNGQKVGDRSNQQVHFLSFSIDPERDSPERLKNWADRFQVNPDQWWLLTGNKKMIYDLIINEMKIPVDDGMGVDTNFLHTDHFVLIDSSRHVRGYYHGLEPASLAKLSQDLVLLTLEKNRNEKSFFAGKLQLIAVVILLAILGVFMLFYLLRKKS